VIQKGDTVICRAARGYDFTTGKAYTVTDYQEQAWTPGFTWPAYVQVRDDSGKLAWAHAHRFVKEDE
jgi:hypothetical protein